ncbi:Uncharacterised protein [Vibrio cholerae]|uniref:Uncharacterized protein n=1 Tax=Vibrio cholerae TaxID=666 RepID=A0A655XTM8_VIBCL|nr:Uncharacterised protein [Vibrio cholerae]CSA96565.1 Uncharacterised protein [Vibrio cholerae]CSB38239.1 Uncharacterised protein [Vibrio cholerae]CSC10885.1 Uncharacterised protein [Vibrio cholerae]CSC20010.1 Uncharacterised protein [Vibrio cholerae]
MITVALQSPKCLLYLGLDKNVTCPSCALSIGATALTSAVGSPNNSPPVIVANSAKVSVVIIFDYLMALITFSDRLCSGLPYCIELVSSTIS